ncbi:3776_t:CDS:2, partial [Racocetra fulgida]
TMLIITPPNIYNTVFREVDNELRNCVTLAITEKIWEQMNHSLLYNATQINHKKDINTEFSCETTCIDEVFDLPQASANTILNELYDQLTSIWETSRTDTTGSATQLPIKWISTRNDEAIELSRQEQAKQRFAKAFGFTKTMINKVIELDLDKKLITMLEDFHEKEIRPKNLELNSMTNKSNKTNITNLNEKNYQGSENETSNSSDRFDEIQKRKAPVVAENPTLKRYKGRLPKAHRILSSIENIKSNQQNMKQRSIKCTYYHEIGHNIRCYKAKLTNEAN